MRKQLLLPILIMLVSSTLSAQDKKWSVEASYPISVGDEFGLDGRGILDLGARYRFLELGTFGLGASLNTSLFFDNSIGVGDEDIDFRQIFLQPRVFMEAKIPGLERLRLSFGVGYAWDFYSSSGIERLLPGDFSRTEGGLNVNSGVAFDVYRNWFLQVQYDYIREDLGFTVDEIGLLKVGLGLRF